MDDGPADLSKRFIARPYSSRKFHVFNPDGRPLCKRMMVLRPDPMSCTNNTGRETYSHTQDCAPCFRAAGINVPPKKGAH